MRWIFREVLKPDGRLVIIECKKEDLPFCPPMHLRHSPEEFFIEQSEYRHLLKDCPWRIFADC